MNLQLKFYHLVIPGIWIFGYCRDGCEAEGLRLFSQMWSLGQIYSLLCNEDPIRKL